MATPSVVRAVGPASMPLVHLRSPHGAASVFEHGAHVTSWTPVRGRDVLWLSSRARYAAGTAIRGGVPICFPWFGPHPHGEGPAHGLARLQDWSLTQSTISDDGSVSVLLELPESGPSASPDRPERLVASYRVTAGRSLRLDLTVRNAGATAATFEAALHTYLRVSDVRRVTVYGLEDMPYIDSAAGDAPWGATGEPLRLECRTDRIYRQPGSIAVDDPGADRVIRVTSEGAPRAVIWNPWGELAATMLDVGDDEWATMLCVETAAVRSGAITLSPGAIHTMSSVIEVGGR